jgi:hypothetical protein
MADWKEERYNCKVGDLELDLSNGIKQVMGIKSPLGTEVESSLEGRTIVEKCSKRLSSQWHRL